MLTIAPLIRQFSRWSNCRPLRYSRIDARLKKPSRLAFSYASRPAVGEGFLTRRFYSGNAVNHSEITGEGGGRLAKCADSRKTSLI